MNKSFLRKITGLVLITLGINLSMVAQVKNDAINAFNEGVEKMKMDPASAIGPFENCIKICDQVGDSAQDIKLKAIQILPDLYYQKASDLFYIDKDIPGTIKVSKQATIVAEKYNDDKVKENLKGILEQAYSMMGSNYYTTKAYDNAVMAFDSVLMINPDNMSALFNKAITYKTLDNGPKFSETLDIYIGKLNPASDSAKIEQVKKMARDYFRILGGKANQANKLTDAINLLITASKYGMDKNVYYQFASVYNKQKKYALAAENAQKGLDMETGTPEDKAKFYYELGSAQVGKGEMEKACESFKNSMYGPFLDASKAQRTNMKCK